MTPLDEEELSRRLSRACALLVLFLALTVVGFYALSAATDATVSQSFAARAVYQLGGALLLAWLAVQALSALRRPWRARPGRWRCPLAAAGLSLCLTALAYAYLGVWPLGKPVCHGWWICTTSMHLCSVTAVSAAAGQAA